MRAAHLPDRAGELRRRLADAREVCGHLGMTEGARPQSGGLLIRCPWHPDRTPSCSVRRAPDGTLSVRCFGCDATGDVLSLVAVARGLDPRRDFPEVLRAAAELIGDRLDDIAPAGPPRRPAPRPHGEPGFAPAAEVASLWGSCRPVTEDDQVASWLRYRSLDPCTTEDRGLARALPADRRLPAWAAFQGQTWANTGYRCIVPVFDEAGTLRGVRARRVVQGDGPKAVPPTGFRAGGLVMADELGRLLLETGRRSELLPAGVPLRIVIPEGEPDFLTWATRSSDADESAPGVIGIGSGSWTDAIAARIPDGSRIVIRTHHDDAGERYARAIHVSLRGRHCSVVRGGARGCARCAEAGWRRGVA